MKKVYENESLGYSKTEPFGVTNSFDCKKQEVVEHDAVEMILFD